MTRMPNLIPPPVRPKIMSFKQFLMHRLLQGVEKAKAPVSPPEASKK